MRIQELLKEDAREYYDAAEGLVNMGETDCEGYSNNCECKACEAQDEAAFQSTLRRMVELFKSEG